MTVKNVDELEEMIDFEARKKYPLDIWNRAGYKINRLLEEYDKLYVAYSVLDKTIEGQME